jgi:hypothetical protein
MRPEQAGNFPAAEREHLGGPQAYRLETLASRYLSLYPGLIGKAGE